MEPQPIGLTKREMVLAAETGIIRNIEAMASGRRDAHGFDDDAGWNAHIEGACGEIAVAKFLRRYWSPSCNTFHAADLGMQIQVRTRSRHDYELIVRSNDDTEHAYVLVTGRAPNFLIHGYFMGHEARRPEWVREHGGRPPAWFVPQKVLRDICDLELAA